VLQSPALTKLADLVKSNEIRDFGEDFTLETYQVRELLTWP
jgi:hypothetical protein